MTQHCFHAALLFDTKENQHLCLKCCSIWCYQLWVMELTILILSCCCLLLKADVLLCSDYLVSGFHGVNDTAMTSSSNYYDPLNDNSAYCGRLDYPGDDSFTLPRLGCWISGSQDTNQYIQVTFPGDCTITAVTVQGRHSLHQQWVKNYYLLYSMDGVAWTTVSSSDGIPKLFNGNVDTQTPVTSPVTPHVKARHLRINPTTWEWYIALRFDVSGCQLRKQNDGCGRFKRKPVFITENMDNLHKIVTAMSTTLSLKDCAAICRNHRLCMAFTYRTADGEQWCTGYSTWIVVPGRIISNLGVFVNQDALDMYGYKEDNEVLYNIIEVKMDQAKASSICTTMYTRLMKIDTASKMSRLQNITAGYFVLKRDLRFYVAGEYSSPNWSYNGGTDMINGALWSSGHPDTGNGYCVMLTQTGLASVDCQQQLFSICGN